MDGWPEGSVRPEVVVAAKAKDGLEEVRRGMRNVDVLDAF